MQVASHYLIYMFYFNQGKVGINMDLPPEAFSVCGNIHLTGQVLNPSDERIKEKIRRVSSYFLYVGEYSAYINLYQHILSF